MFPPFWLSFLGLRLIEVVDLVHCHGQSSGTDMEGSAVTETRADSASRKSPGTISGSGRESSKTARVASGVLVMKMPSAP